MPDCLTLYRPATPQQLQQVADQQWQAFGTASLYQQYFYPMLYREYARLIARRWNARQHGQGFVLACRVDAAWLERFPVQTIATERQREYCIPARHLAGFNAHLHGRIRLIDVYGEHGLPVPEALGLTG